jgi:hypothetical protein
LDQPCFCSRFWWVCLVGIESETPELAATSPARRRSGRVEDSTTRQREAPAGGIWPGAEGCIGGNVDRGHQEPTIRARYLACHWANDLKSITRQGPAVCQPFTRCHTRKQGWAALG